MRETTTNKKQPMKVSIYNGISDGLMSCYYGSHQDSEHGSIDIIVL